MHDIKWIRDDPDAFDKGIARRGLEPQSANILALDEQRRAVQTQLQDLQTRRNAASKEIGAAKATKDEARANVLMAEVADIKTTIPQLEEQERSLYQSLNDALSSLPNIPYPDVPDGTDEDDNLELKTWGTPRSFDFEPKAHNDLGKDLGQMLLDTAAKISGSRFAMLTGDLAKLERALSAYMLNIAGNNGYTEVSAPLLVRSPALQGTGQLPKFSEDLFKIADSDLWLIPTAEVPLTNIVSGEILAQEKLPLRLCAYTPCFRSEAGSAGKDTTGIIRLHQFYKVELVSIITPEQSTDELDRMTTIAEQVLEGLELPYRRVSLCTGDLGFGAHKTYDLETWFPQQQKYREISSCSVFGAFQARRMNAKYRDDDSKPQFVHTLNGSALGMSRCLAAIMENYQNIDGTISIPSALQPLMNTDCISPNL